MKLLDAIEQGIDRAMTALPDAIFRTRLHQEELGQLLVREMERKSQRQRGKTTVPTRFEVELSPEDMDQIDLPVDELQAYLEGMLRKAALQRSADYGRGFDVDVTETDGVKRRRPRIEASFVPQGSATGQTVPTNAPRGRFVAALVPLEGHSGRQRFVVPAGRTTIGRGADNHIVLPSQFVSQHHARIEASERSVRLFDVQSTNGTRVNGEPVSQWDLESGDEVEFGDMKFRFDVGRGS